MSHSKIVMMANQIATFFESQPGDQGPKNVAEHINRFWEKRMRRQFFEILEADPSGMKDMVIEAAAFVSRPDMLPKNHQPENSAPQ
jgi:formate dehydrogenase subunit delta